MSSLPLPRPGVGQRPGAGLPAVAGRARLPRGHVDSPGQCASQCASTSASSPAPASSVYRARGVRGPRPRAAGLLGPGLHHGAALRHPRGPLLPRLQAAVLPGLHAGGGGRAAEVQS